MSLSSLTREVGQGEEHETVTTIKKQDLSIPLPGPENVFVPPPLS